MSDQPRTPFQAAFNFVASRTRAQVERLQMRLGTPVVQGEEGASPPRQPRVAVQSDWQSDSVRRHSPLVITPTTPSVATARVSGPSTVPGGSDSNEDLDQFAASVTMTRLVLI